MLKMMREGFRGVLWGVMILSLSGCFAVLLGAAAGVGGYAWVKGSLVKEFNVSADKLHRATVNGVKSLDLPVKEDQGDRLSAKVISRFSDEKKIRIDIDAMTETTSKINIRVGIFGDKLRSEMIYNAIQKQL